MSQLSATHPLAEHLAELPGQSWAIWRWVGLRGAGFPAAWVARLADAACAERADRLLEAQNRLQRAHTAALVAVNAALDALRAADSWDDQARRQPLLDALRGLRGGSLPGQLTAHATLPGAVVAALDTVAEAQAAVEALGNEFAAELAAATARSSAALRELAADERLREALIWQNRHAFHTAILALSSRTDGLRNSRQRQHEELIASYVQRYCVKNDTIGFFGPVGWARLDDRSPALEARPGPALLHTRHVAFEQWTIDALAETLSADPWLRPWLAPRLLPSAQLSGTTLHRPGHPPRTLAPAQAAVLRACDGTATARAITATIRQQFPMAIRSEADVYKLLEQLSQLGLIAWTLELPFMARPERELRRRLERIGESRLRQPALDTLDELERLRDDVAAAAGDSARLDRALAALEQGFTRLTGTAATRQAGATYAARTLVHEDCQRDVEVTIGPQVLAQLGPPLSLLLQSARWLTHTAAVSYRAAFGALYDRLAAQHGPAIELTDFMQQVQLQLLGDRPALIQELIEQFQARWAAVLDLPDDRRRVSYSSAALAPRVAEHFAAPGPGWQGARQHSPDVLIAAASPEAIQRGEYELVMGELHVAANTLRGAFFVAHHPQPDELRAATAHDLPEPRILALPPRSWPEITARTRPELVNAHDWLLALTNESFSPSPERVLPIGALVVTRAAERLLVRSRDGRHSFEIIESFADLLALKIIDSFKLIAPRPHTPRITVDRLVIVRESWRFEAAALTFAAAPDEAARFLAARRWQQAHDLPRRAFVKTPVERKPFYVDFDSPTLINLLARAVRRAAQAGPDATITLSEMLPTPEQAWLPDAAGARYTSELRLVAVDQRWPSAPDHR